MKICDKCKKGKKCIECKKEYNRNYYLKNKDKWKSTDKTRERKRDYFKTNHGKFIKYKIKSKERNILFSIEENEFLFYINKNCFYCNVLGLNGLDRVNNLKNYENGNIVSCCINCNKLKNNLSIENWENYIIRLKEYMNNNKNTFFDHNCLTKQSYTIGRRFSWYKTSAKRRNVEFNLTKEQFSSFKNVPCHYCGTITNVIGLDRMNNNKGYEISNIVSCCKICNSGKQTMPYNEWKEHLLRLSKFDINKLKDFKND